MLNQTQIFHHGVVSSVGNVRAINEDNYAIIEECGLFVVCDGMGGHSRGDLASRLAVETVQRLASSMINMEEMVRSTHARIREVAYNNEGASGMGTTIVLVRIIDREYEAVWVGDSRLYIWDQIRLHQVSVDHTYVQELLDSGLITYSEFLHHPQKHLLTSSLGASTDDDLIISTRTGFISSHDTLLLCSDGITNEISEQQIIDVLSADYMDNQEKARELVASANKYGGHDNSTALVVNFSLAEEGITQYDENFITKQTYNAIVE